MSGRSLINQISTLAIAFATVALTVPLLPEPTSTSEKKKSFIRGSTGAKHTVKVRGPIDVSVELLGAQPIVEGDAFVLRGQIVSSEALSNVEYSWTIPPELELINGTLSSTISDLDSRHPILVQVTLQQKSIANGRVHFRARAVSAEMKFGDSTQYNSMMQESLDIARGDLKRSSEEELATQKARTLGFLSPFPEKLKVAH